MYEMSLAQRFTDGADLGCSEWLQLTQPMLTSFEELTLSNDPLHTDPAWVKRHTRYASTIAPGFLTASLLPFLAAQAGLTPAGYVAVNYGFDRLRWPTPVPVNAFVRANFFGAGVNPFAHGQDGVIARINVNIEIRGQDRPGMVAIWLAAMLPDALPSHDIRA